MVRPSGWTSRPAQAGCFLHAHPDDPRLLASWRASRDAFARAAVLLPHPAEAVEVPYEGTTLSGYFDRVHASAAPRPTLIFHGGLDSTLEELYPAAAVAALVRGYHGLTFAGPGQGRAIREQGLPFRPDWERVVTPVVDYALSRPEVDATRLALLGWSLGGYLAPRAAAYEHRLAALIAWDGAYDNFAAARPMLPAGAHTTAKDTLARDRFITLNGVGLHYRDRGPATAPPLLLLHGFGEQARCYDTLAAALADRFRVLAPDQRGHGET